MIKNKFRSDTTIYALSQIVERLLSFFLLPLLTKEITIEEYGIWSQLILIIGVSTPILLLGLQTALVRFLPQMYLINQARNSLILNVFLIVFCSVVIMAIGFAILREELSLFFFGSVNYVIFVLLLIVYIAAEVLFEFLVAILRSEGVIRRVSYYILTKSTLRLFVFLFLLKYLDFQFELAVIVFITLNLGLVLVFTVYELPLTVIAESGLASARPYLKDVLCFALPIVPLAILTGVNNAADRFFITQILGVDKLAAYAAAYSLAGIAGFFYSVLGFTLFPAMSSSWSQGSRELAIHLLKRSLRIYLFFLLPFIAILAMLGPDILVLLSTELYRISGLIFFLLSLSVGLFGLYQMAMFVLILEGRSVSGLWLMGLTTVISIGLNILFIPLWGLLGASLAIFLANSVLVLLTGFIALQILPIKLTELGLWKIVIKTGFIGGTLFLVKLWIAVDSLEILIFLMCLMGLIYLAADYLTGQSVLREFLKRDEHKS
jgi:O-antigen/teichoic acid export membrane protein